jgi:hypothetical protein
LSCTAFDAVTALLFLRIACQSIVVMKRLAK